MSSTGHSAYAHATTRMFGGRQAVATRRPGGMDDLGSGHDLRHLAVCHPDRLRHRLTGHPTRRQPDHRTGQSRRVHLHLGIRDLSVLLRVVARPVRHEATARDRGRARHRRPFLYAATTNFGTLALAQIVLAIGSSFGFVGAGYVGGKWFDGAKYGLMFGLVQMFASLGSAVGQPAISALLGVMSWQAVLAGFGAFGVLLVIGFILIVRNPVSTPEEIAAKTAHEGKNLFAEIFSDLGACFRNRQVVLSALFAGASFGTMLAVGVLWGPRVQEARGASLGFAAILSALAWLGLAFGAPLVNVISSRWHSRKWPAVCGLILQACAVALFIYGPSNGPGASVVVMFAVGLLAGTHMLGFTIAGESVTPNLIGSSAAIVNGVCFIIGGILEAVPGRLLPAENPNLSDYQGALWIMPVVLVIGAICALGLRERPHDQPDLGAEPSEARSDTVTT
jgi:MFS family permease